MTVQELIVALGRYDGAMRVYAPWVLLDAEVVTAPCTYLDAEVVIVPCTYLEGVVIRSASAICDSEDT